MLAADLRLMEAIGLSFPLPELLSDQISAFVVQARPRYRRHPSGPAKCEFPVLTQAFGRS
jgi:hypothetical protein